MVKFGVIGAGAIAKTFSEAMTQTNGKLYAIASRDINKAQSYQKAYGYEKIYGSYEQLLSDPLVDIVYIATPHGLHYEHMLLAIKYNKHILCEKSFTLNAMQAKKIFDEAKRKNLFVMEAMWTRFLPVIKEVKKQIDEDLIGQITSIKASFGFNMDSHNKDRLSNPTLGGGALLDIGVYPIHFAYLFLGEPESFKTKAKLDPSGIDLFEESTFFYPNAHANLSSSFEEELDRTAVITGTKGYIKVYDFWRTEKAQIFDLKHNLINDIYIPHKKNGFEYEINEVINCLNHHLTESPLMPFSLTYKVMSQMDSLRAIWGLKYPNEDIS